MAASSNSERIDRRALGQRGEQAAESFLCRRGLTVVHRNYHCRGGEIDLVMLDPNPQDAEVLAFVEVRLRGPGPVSGLESIGPMKQRRLIHAARHFLMSFPRWQDHPCRFDVVAIDSETDTLNWIPNAFEVA